MSPILIQHRQAVADTCRRFDVEKLEVFGSAARSDFDARSSDVDLIVRFHQPERPGYAERYLALAESLESLLGRPVDLVTERSFRNPLFVRKIAPDRTTVYAS